VILLLSFALYRHDQDVAWLLQLLCKIRDYAVDDLRLLPHITW
jgi:hypothetical protein